MSDKARCPICLGEHEVVPLTKGLDLVGCPKLGENEAYIVPADLMALLPKVKP